MLEYEIYAELCCLIIPVAFIFMRYNRPVNLGSVNFGSVNLSPGNANAMKSRGMLPGLRYTLFAVLLGVQAITLVAVLALGRSSTEAITREHAHQILNHLADTTADNTRRFLEPAEHSATLSRELLERGVLKANDTVGLERYFLAQLHSNPQLAGIYLGQTNGGFVFVKRDSDGNSEGFSSKFIGFAAGARQVSRITRDANLNIIKREMLPADTYDPRSRPWYRAANQAGATIWTDPYVFFTSKRPGVTAASPVMRANKMIGVIGVDIEISGLSNFLNDVPLSEHGRAFIVDRNGTAVAFPKLDWVGREFSDELPQASMVGGAVVQSMLSSGSSHALPPAMASFEVGQDGYFGILRPFAIGNGTTWLIGVHAPSQDFMQEFVAQNAQQNSRIAWIFGLTCLLAWPLVFGATLPFTRLQRQATIDDLTGLPNRAEFMRQASRNIMQLHRQGRTAVIAILDLDGFKQVNDQFGHQSGDEVLQIVGQRLQMAARESDLIGRLGGDEFALLLPDVGADQAQAFVARIRSSLCDQPMRSSVSEHRIGATIGVTSLEHASSLRELLARADQALLSGKSTSKNQTYVSAAI
jgi:diguanylate cyclase (GGDEF)-like protein